MKKIIGLFTILLFATMTFAQTNIDRAEKLFSYVVAGMGDSVYSCMNEKAQAALPVSMLNGLMQQLQPIYGKYSNHEAWKTKESMGMTVYYCDAVFDKGTLCFLTAFDSNGKANTLRFIPAEPKPIAEQMPSTIIERRMTLVSGMYKLPALLTLPKNQKNIPVVVLVHGSGPNGMDETIGPNRPFHDLAWELAQKGVAVLRYDKRTKVYGDKYVPVGSEANLDNEVIEDVIAAVSLAMKQPEVNVKRVYVIGHSLGAMLAPRIAQRIKGLAGIVMMAANARPLEDVTTEQIIYLHSQQTPNNDDFSKINEMKRRADNVKKIGTPLYDASVGLPFDLPLSYWTDLKNYDQVATAMKLYIPIFIMQGMRDYQVTMTDFALWKRNLRASRKIQFKSYPKLNHLFMEGTGPANPVEYMTPKHIPDYVIEDIVTFVNHGVVQ